MKIMSTLPDCQPTGQKCFDKNLNQSTSKSTINSSSGIDGMMNTDSGINAESKFRANRFLRVHLHILKVLYDQEGMVPPTSGDSIDEKYWGIIEAFLVERNTIRRTTKRAQRMLEIHDEAMEFQKNLPPISIVNNPILSHQFSPRHGTRNHDKGSRSNFKFGSSALMLITQPSPHYRTPRGWNGRGGQSALRRNEVQGETMDNVGGNAFGIVSGLLKRKHDLASRGLNRRTSKLRALMKESQRRIETLDSELKATKEIQVSSVHNLGDNIEDFILAKEEREDRQVRIETKIRLWKLLLHDLMGTISVQTQQF